MESGRKNSARNCRVKTSETPPMNEKGQSSNHKHTESKPENVPHQKKTSQPIRGKRRRVGTWTVPESESIGNNSSQSQSGEPNTSDLLSMYILDYEKANCDRNPPSSKSDAVSHKPKSVSNTRTVIKINMSKRHTRSKTAEPASSVCRDRSPDVAHYSVNSHRCVIPRWTARKSMNSDAMKRNSLRGLRSRHESPRKPTESSSLTVQNINETSRTHSSSTVTSDVNQREQEVSRASRSRSNSNQSVPMDVINRRFHWKHSKVQSPPETSRTITTQTGDQERYVHDDVFEMLKKFEHEERSSSKETVPYVSLNNVGHFLKDSKSIILNEHLKKVFALTLQNRDSQQSSNTNVPCEFDSKSEVLSRSKNNVLRARSTERLAIRSSPRRSLSKDSEIRKEVTDKSPKAKTNMCSMYTSDRNKDSSDDTSPKQTNAEIITKESMLPNAESRTEKSARGDDVASVLSDLIKTVSSNYERKSKTMATDTASVYDDPEASLSSTASSKFSDNIFDIFSRGNFEFDRESSKLITDVHDDNNPDASDKQVSQPQTSVQENSGDNSEASDVCEKLPQRRRDVDDNPDGLPETSDSPGNPEVSQTCDVQPQTKILGENSQTGKSRPDNIPTMSTSTESSKTKCTPPNKQNTSSDTSSDDNIEMTSAVLLSKSNIVLPSQNENPDGALCTKDKSDTAKPTDCAVRIIEHKPGMESLSSKEYLEQKMMDTCENQAQARSPLGVENEASSLSSNEFLDSLTSFNHTQISSVVEEELDKQALQKESLNTERSLKTRDERENVSCSMSEDPVATVSSTKQDKENTTGQQQEAISSPLLDNVSQNSRPSSDENIHDTLFKDDMHQQNKAMPGSKTQPVRSTDETLPVTSISKEKQMQASPFSGDQLKPTRIVYRSILPRNVEHSSMMVLSATQINNMCSKEINKTTPMLSSSPPKHYRGDKEQNNTIPESDESYCRSSPNQEKTETASPSNQSMDESSSQIMPPVCSDNKSIERDNVPFTSVVNGNQTPPLHVNKDIQQSESPSKFEALNDVALSVKENLSTEMSSYDRNETDISSNKSELEENMREKNETHDDFTQPGSSVTDVKDKRAEMTTTDVTDSVSDKIAPEIKVVRNLFGETEPKKPPLLLKVKDAKDDSTGTNASSAVADNPVADEADISASLTLEAARQKFSESLSRAAALPHYKVQRRVLAAPAAPPPKRKFLSDLIAKVESRVSKEDGAESQVDDQDDYSEDGDVEEDEGASVYDVSSSASASSSANSSPEKIIQDSQSCLTRDRKTEVRSLSIEKSPRKVKDSTNDTHSTNLDTEKNRSLLLGKHLNKGTDRDENGIQSEPELMEKEASMIDESQKVTDEDGELVVAAPPCSDEIKIQTSDVSDNVNATSKTVSDVCSEETGTASEDLDEAGMQPDLQIDSVFTLSNQSTKESDKRTMKMHGKDRDTHKSNDGNLVTEETPDQSKVKGEESVSELLKYLTSPFKKSSQSVGNTGTQDSSKIEKLEIKTEDLQPNSSGAEGKKDGVNPYAKFEKPDSGDKKSAFVSDALEEYLQTNATLKTSLKQSSSSGDVKPVRCSSLSPRIDDKNTSPFDALKTKHQTINQVVDADFDEIGGYTFMSFSSKVDMESHLKVERLSRCQGCTGSDVINHLRLLKKKASERPIKGKRGRPSLSQKTSPDKTDDVTKIKGWKSKFRPEARETVDSGSKPKLHWKTQEKLTKRLTPNEIRKMGLDIKKKRRKNPIYTHRKNSRQLESLLTRHSLKQIEPHVPGLIIHAYKRIPDMTKFQEVRKTIKDHDVAVHGKPGKKKGLNLPMLTHSMAVSAVKALQVQPRGRCEKPGCRYGCVCLLCEPEVQTNDFDVDLSGERSSSIKCEKEYCRLGCICESLEGTTSRGAHEKKKKSHCGRADCIFGCVCKAMLRSSQQRSLQSERDLEPPVLDKVKHGSVSMLGNIKNELPLQTDYKVSLRLAKKISKLEAIAAQKGPAKVDDSNVRKSRRLKEKGLTTHKALIMMEAQGLMNIEPDPWSPPRVNRQRKAPTHEHTPTTITNENDSSNTDALPEKEISRRTKMLSDIYGLNKDKDDEKTKSKRIITEMCNEEEEDMLCARMLAYCPIPRAMNLSNDLKEHQSSEVVSMHSTASPTVKDTENSQASSESDINVETDATTKSVQQAITPHALCISTSLQKTPASSVPENPQRFTKQMVLLERKESKKTGAGPLSSKVPHLLEISADCNWQPIRNKLLNVIAQELEKNSYPEINTFALLDYKVKVLKKAKTPTVIPEHLQKMLPGDLYAVRIKINQLTNQAAIGVPLAEGSSEMIDLTSQPGRSISPQIQMLDAEPQHLPLPGNTEVGVPGGISGLSRLKISTPIGHNSPSLDASLTNKKPPVHVAINKTFYCSISERTQGQPSTADTELAKSKKKKKKKKKNDKNQLPLNAINLMKGEQVIPTPVIPFNVYQKLAPNDSLLSVKLGADPLVFPKNSHQLVLTSVPTTPVITASLNSTHMQPHMKPQTVPSVVTPSTAQARVVLLPAQSSTAVNPAVTTSSSSKVTTVPMLLIVPPGGVKTSTNTATLTSGTSLLNSSASLMPSSTLSSTATLTSPLTLTSPNISNQQMVAVPSGIPGTSNKIFLPIASNGQIRIPLQKFIPVSAPPGANINPIVRAPMTNTPTFAPTPASTIPPPAMPLRVITIPSANSTSSTCQAAGPSGPTRVPVSTKMPPIGSLDTGSMQNSPSVIVENNKSAGAVMTDNRQNVNSVKKSVIHEKSDDMSNVKSSEMASHDPPRDQRMTLCSIVTPKGGNPRKTPSVDQPEHVAANNSNEEDDDDIEVTGFTMGEPPVVTIDEDSDSGDAAGQTDFCEIIESKSSSSKAANQDVRPCHLIQNIYSVLDQRPAPGTLPGGGNNMDAGERKPEEMVTTGDERTNEDAESTDAEGEAQTKKSRRKPVLEERVDSEISNTSTDSQKTNESTIDNVSGSISSADTNVERSANSQQSQGGATNTVVVDQQITAKTVQVKSQVITVETLKLMKQRAAAYLVKKNPQMLSYMSARDQSLSVAALGQMSDSLSQSSSAPTLASSLRSSLSESESDVDIEGLDESDYDIDVETCDDLAPIPLEALWPQNSTQNEDSEDMQQISNRLYVHKTSESILREAIERHFRERERRHQLHLSFLDLRNAVNLQAKSGIVSKQLILDEAIKLIKCLKKRNKKLMKELSALKSHQMFLKLKLQKLRGEMQGKGITITSADSSPLPSPESEDVNVDGATSPETLEEDTSALASVQIASVFSLATSANKTHTAVKKKLCEEAGWEDEMMGESSNWKTETRVDDQADVTVVGAYSEDVHQPFNQKKRRAAPVAVVAPRKKFKPFKPMEASQGLTSADYVTFTEVNQKGGIDSAKMDSSFETNQSIVVSLAESESHSAPPTMCETGQKSDVGSNFSEDKFHEERNDVVSISLEDDSEVTSTSVEMDVLDPSTSDLVIESDVQ